MSQIRDALRAHRAVVVTAAPGSGKTTRVPPALVEDGPVILLQPRRVAARAIARRIADERGWTPGQEVGWHIRFERRFGPRTRLLVATEGILTARLQQDPLLSDFRTVVLDEFHERSIHADLGLALARQAWRARDDLRIVVMSATLDAGRVAAYLGDCPAIVVPGRRHPLTVEYAPGVSVDAAVCGLLPRTSGNVLCFLPGAPEIRRALPAVRATAPGVEVVELHGSLDADAQDAALRDTGGRRVILSTNIAETSLTVPGVAAVVDCGLQKLPRYDIERGFDHLRLERITQDSADQRAGRAGRLGPGVAVRLWDQRDRLRLHREPDIARIDLAGPVLDVLAWGGDPAAFEWFEAPSPETLEAALSLLARLRALETGRLTRLGERIRALPLHPRLGAVLVAGRGAFEAAAACALLADGLRGRAAVGATTTSDVLPALDAWAQQPGALKQAADQLCRMALKWPASDRSERIDESDLRRALLAGYPDRVARRRETGSPRLLLATGTGAELARDSGVRDAEWLVALDVARATTGGDARVFAASAIERDWLEPTSSTVEHALTDDGRVGGTRVTWYDALRLAEAPVTPDPTTAASLLAQAFLSRPHDEATTQLLRRLRFIGADIDLPGRVAQAASRTRSLDDIDLAALLPWDLRTRLDREAPKRLDVPSGRTAALDYRDDGSVAASVKLQELFGLAETPRIGTRGEPVLLLLLAPNGRPVQTTRDLRSFWERTYPEVRKELRGRHPRHPWPEDPWTATPTARTTKRKDRT
ncbi:MAG: ATP-dependent RNA helicase [Vicinamibacteria bacterium]|nr:ATP-dependent RNA helicase [Vicinamibacteria bacterium]